VQAATSLTVTPITWDVIGLDSNNVSVGPNRFPVGVKVCNTGGTAATNVTVTFAWTSANSFIDLQGGTNSSVAVGAISGGSCAEAYFNVEIARNAAAYTTSRRYVITATDSGSGASSTSPTPRQIYVERLVSQNRNSTNSILVNSSTIPGGAVQDLLLGGTYTFTLNSSTSTQGYEQLETFLGLPNSVFQVQSVSTTFSANTSPFIENPPVGGATHPQL